MNYLFLNTNFALKLQGKCWKDDVITFTAHLSVNMKRWTRYEQEVVLAAMLEGKSMPSNMVANTNHTTLLKNKKKKCLKISPLMRFLPNFGFEIIFVCSNNFRHQQDSNSLLKGSIGPREPYETKRKRKRNSFICYGGNFQRHFVCQSFPRRCCKKCARESLWHKMC